MLSEHEKGHKLSLQLKKLVASYQSGDEQAATGIRQTIKNYVESLERHIAKENNVLFPMAENKLDANRDNALFAAFERHERERMDAGKDDAFDSLPG
jgi:hemerythrin-like domain-containing protein